MTKSPKITVQSRNGYIQPRVRHGWFDVDGVEAMIIILIIVAVRIVRRVAVFITRVTVRVIKIVSPKVASLTMITARWSLRHLAGAILAFRAFYTP